MIFLAIIYFCPFILTVTANVEIFLTCRSTGFFIRIEQKETAESFDLTLTDISKRGYLENNLVKPTNAACQVDEKLLNETNNFIEQFFPFTECGRYNQTDHKYYTRLAYGLD